MLIRWNVDKTKQRQARTRETDKRDSVLVQCAEPSAPISLSTDLVGVQFAPAACVFTYLFSLN